MIYYNMILNNKSSYKIDTYSVEKIKNLQLFVYK